MLFTSAVASHSGYTITQLTDNDYNDQTPQINDNGYVVWTGNSGRIFLYDGANTIQIADNGYTPQINNNGHVAWNGSDGTDWQIYLYDGDSIIQITDNSFTDESPQINDNGYIAWSGGTDSYDSSAFNPCTRDGYEIFLYDGNSITQITNNAVDDHSVQINNNGQIVWKRYHGLGRNSKTDPCGTVYGKAEIDYEIFYYDGTNITQITDNSCDESNIQLNENGDVVWDCDGEIYLYNGTAVVQITDNDFVDSGSNPDINDSGHIVWVSYNGDLFLYNGVSTLNIGNGSNPDSLPQISNNGHIVWRIRNGLYIYDGTSTSLITDNASGGHKINNNGYVVWTGLGEPEYEIFLAIPNTLSVYRFWSDNFRGHFYTANEAEKQHLICCDPNWNYEGIAWFAYLDEKPGTVPIYRFWSYIFGHHFYTASLSERDHLICCDSNWNYEGIAWYAYPYELDNTLSIYRFWSDNFRGHFFTASEGERDQLINNDPNWSYEGVAYHALP